MKEITRCFNYPNYHVTSDGEVIGQNGKPLKPHKDKKGYLRVSLRRNGKSISALVHRLVAFQFLDEVEGKFYVNHKDGNKSNNNVSNLEWVTEEENIKHAKETGLIKRGEDHYSVKLSDKEVQFIKENYKPRDPLYGGKALSLRFEVSRSHISGIINGTKRV